MVDVDKCYNKVDTKQVNVNNINGRIAAHHSINVQ